MAEPEEDIDPLSTLIQSIALRSARDAAKVVVFATRTEMASEIATRLASELGHDVVLTHIETHTPAQAVENLERFRDGTAPLTLVCDRSGEEGLNLQCADLLFHADLPWDPNRLEQRIGRLDRIGRDRPVHERVLVPYDGCDSPYEAWCYLLRDGFRIFSESVADLQFFVEKTMPEVRLAIFCEGASSLKALADSLKEGIAEERRLLAEQSALDEIEAFDREDTDFFTGMRSCDEDDRHHQIALEGWLLDALRFKCETPNGAVYDRYGFETPAKCQSVVRYQSIENTLMPATARAALQRYQRGFGTFKRDLAASKNLQLLRIGDQFVDALNAQLSDDDRGKVFMLWRHLPGLSQTLRLPFFRLDYLIQTDLTSVSRVVAELGWPPDRLRPLLRKSDSWFPPHMRTLYINASLRVETRSEVIDLLARPYLSADKGGQDYSLNMERAWALDEVVSPDHWGVTCEQVRSCAISAIRQDVAFQEHCRMRFELSEREMVVRAEQVRHGLAFRHGMVPLADIETEEVVLRALADGVREPQVKLDAVGLLILSGWNPFT